MDKKIIIPIDTYKRIESWLIKDIGYDRNMMEPEFTESFAIYSDRELRDNIERVAKRDTIFHYRVEKKNNNKYTEEDVCSYYLNRLQYLQNYKEKFRPDDLFELYLSGTECDYPTSDDIDEIIEFVLQIGKNLVFDVGAWGVPNLMRFTTNDITQLWHTHIKKDLNNEINNDVLHGILFLTGIWLKHKATKGMFGWERAAIFEKPMPNKEKIRPEMLEVYKLFHADSKTNNRMVELQYNKETLKIKNTDNWFTTMLDFYFNDYLHINNYEEADIELSDFDPYYTPDKKGRKPDVQFLTLTISIYRLLKHVSFSDKGLTNDEANFILGYLKLLGVIEEGGTKDDILNLRATINNLLNKNYNPQWWNKIIFI